MKIEFISMQDLKEFQDALLAKIESLLKDSKAVSIPDYEFLTSKQVQTVLQISHTTLWHWENKGYLVAHQISGRKRYQKSAVLAAMVKRESKKS